MFLGSAHAQGRGIIMQGGWREHYVYLEFLYITKAYEKKHYNVFKSSD